MEITLVTGIVVALCGIIVGILSAMFGIGGGIVMVPLLHIGFGLPAAFASGTSLFAILPTSISGLIARAHDGTIKWRIGIIIGIAGACASPLGAWVSGLVPGIYAMILTGIFILFTAYKMFKRVWRTRPQAMAHISAEANGSGAVNGNKTPADKTSAPTGSQRTHLLDIETTPAIKLYPWCILLGIIVGFLSGYLGLGGGFLIVPVLQGVFGFTMKQSSGTSLISVAFFSLPAFIMHAILGHIAWIAGLLLIVGSVIGTRMGAAILKHVNDRLLTGLFGVLLILTGIVMIVREFIG